MALCQSADSRIAGHLTYGICIDREQQSLRSHSSRSQSCFDAGMSSADYYDIVDFG